MLWEYRVVEQRYDAVMEVVRDGRTVTEVAERWGISRQSLYAWMNRYAAGGLEGLTDRSHRPRSCPHQLPRRWRCGSVSCAGAIPTGGRGGSPRARSRRGGAAAVAFGDLPGVGAP